MTAAELNLLRVVVRRDKRTLVQIDRLQIRPGEFVGIIGTNGAGKTTLLKLCCGLIKPNQGRIELNGADLTTLSGWGKSTLRKQIGYVPQAAEYNADLPFTLREVVAMGRTSRKPLFSRLNREDYRKVDRWLDKLGLADQARQTFRSLSGGEQQKALIARAMVAEPTILMLDEPGASLDFNWKGRLTCMIDELYQQTKITVLMVSHETNLLPPSCRRVLLLHKGNILADGQTKNVLRSGVLDKAYQCRTEVVDVAGQMFTIRKR